jgi:hypothetical protein
MRHPRLAGKSKWKFRFISQHLAVMYTLVGGNAGVRSAYPDMGRISLAEAREDWDRELRARRWHNAKLRLAMFDYNAVEHGSISYHPAPAWPTIADAAGFAKVSDFERLKHILFAQGKRYSSLGSTSATHPSAAIKLTRQPLVFSSTAVRKTIAAVMDDTHPLVVTQEQILRAAFIARLPSPISLAIGTPNSPIHLERPTPSLYQHTGMKPSRARFDIGFGDGDVPDGITGVIELKAGLASFDSLDRKGELVTADPESAAHKGKRGEPIRVDIQKLLDPKLPSGAFRISWIALGRIGRANSEEVKERAQRIVEHGANRRGLTTPSVSINLSTGWLQFLWKGTGVILELAWFRPCSTDPSKYAAIWAR